MRFSPLRALIPACFLLCSALQLPAADLTVPELDLLTRGVWNDATGSVDLSTIGNARIELSGGYKFGGNMALGFTSNDLGFLSGDAEDSISGSDAQADVNALAAYLDNTTFLRFIGAEIEYRELFGAPGTTLSYFIGETDTFASGDVFPELFGTAPIATRYRGERYFDSGYDGIHTVNGTGLSVGTGWGTDWNRTELFLYQDGYLGRGIYSFDAWSVFNLNSIQIETFLGATFPEGPAGLYRAGFLFYYNPGSTGEFLAEIGIPRWQAPDGFAIGDFYFLFEPRIHLDPLTVILTLFWQPNYYLQTEQAEGESADIHINFLFGDSPESTVSGGLETSFVVNTDYSATGDDQFEIVTSPYISLSTPGVSWNFAVDVNLIPFDPATLVEGVINIKAAF